MASKPVLMGPGKEFVEKNIIRIGEVIERS